MNIFSYIAIPFKVLMEYTAEYLAGGNYGVAIIFFTLFIKIILLPLNIKQQKSTIRMQKLQPELKAVQEQCGNDKELLMQEQQKLYAKYNVNPMAGCLPTLIQLPILIIVYNIIRDLGKTEGANMVFLKIFDLSVVPSTALYKWGVHWNLAPLLLIPIITLVSQFAIQWMTSPGKKKKDKNNEVDPTQRSMNLMLKFMPFMTFFIALTTQAGLGFYWAVSNVLTLAQTYFTNKLIEKSEKEG